MPDFVAARSALRLLSLAATRSSVRVSCVNRVLTTALQFDFRGFSLLQLVHIGSVVSRLRWSMLSWFSILFRGPYSLCRALPVLIHYRCNTSVTSLTLAVYVGSLLLRLAPSLLRAKAGWFHSALPRLASSFTLPMPLTLSGSPHLLLISLQLSPFLAITKKLISALTLRRFAPTA